MTRSGEPRASSADDGPSLELDGFIRRRFRSLVADVTADGGMHRVSMEGDEHVSAEISEAFRRALRDRAPWTALTFAEASADLVRAVAMWQVSLLAVTHPSAAARLHWFGPDEMSLTRRFPWPTLCLELDAHDGFPPVSLRVHTPDKGVLHVAPPGSFTPSDSRPDATVDYLAAETGLRIEPLRILTSTSYEFSDVRASHDLIGPRSTWQQPGWTRRLGQELSRELSDAGIALRSDLRTVRHSSVTALCTVQTSVGRLWVKVAHPLFTAEAEFLRRVPVASRGELPAVVVAGGGWFAMADFSSAEPRPNSVVGCVLAFQEEMREAVRTGAFDPGHLLVRPLDDFLSVAVGLESLGWMPRSICERVRARAPQIVALLGDSAQSVETVTHGDLNSANIAPVGEGFVLHDWTDVALAPAGVDLITLERSLRDPTVAAAIDSALGGRVETSVERARAVAEITTDAFQLVNYDRMVRGVDQSAADHSSGASLQSHLLEAASRLAFGSLPS